MAKRVLIIEDNADLAGLLEMVLTGAGHEVEATPSGLAGLLRFQEKPFDAVLLDMQLEDLSGPGAHRAIRDLCPTAAVICMSAQRAGWIDDALKQGATACLSKPFSPDQLVALLDVVWRSEQRPSGPPSDVRTLGPGDLARLAALGPEDLDALLFGAIRIDAASRVTAYNSYEALATKHSTRAVLGTRFADLAPCTLVKEFMSCVEDGFQSKHMDRVLRFVFPRHGACCMVALRLYYDPGFEQMWVFVSVVHGERAR
jgi:photoactive yellow protein